MNAITKAIEDTVAQIKTYNPTADIACIERAYELAQTAHQNQKRADGSDYISHPLAVASILASKKLDDCSVIAALLHDTVEDTDISIDDIKKQYGGEIATLVEGVTKLSNFGFISSQAKQAENFRRLLLATSKDIRVLLIKLADRLHNMRTIEHLKPDSQKRIAFETLEIYVPLAERIGIRDWKEELEDISFSITNKRAYNSIVKRLETVALEKSHIDKIITDFLACFKKNNLQVEISGRQKKPASIWKKLQRKRRFHHLSDIVAFRILTDSVAECYQALGVIHETYQMVPGEFKDYISLPKSNGYKSIHTLVLLPEGQQVEVQIRTHEMHHHAEYGVAAHWQYKQNSPLDIKQEGRKYQWIRSLLDILEHATTPEDFLANTKMDLYNAHVFVFSPNGEIRDLPYGATPIDYAYAIHSDIGTHCKAARINGHLTPIKSRLKNGDQVEIITSRNQYPTQEWLKYVKTGRARTAIRRYLRHANHEEYLSKGMQLLEKTFEGANLKFQKKMLGQALEYYQQKDIDNLLGLVGHGDIDAHDVLILLFPDAKKTLALKQKKAVPEMREKAKPRISPIKNIDKDMPLKIARCCHPLPGDSIIGIVNTGRGITVHKKACRDIAYKFIESANGQENNSLDLQWHEDAENMNFTSRCWIEMENRPNILSSVTTVVGQQGGNITQINSSKNNGDNFTCTIDIEIDNKQKLNNILLALNALPTTHNIRRL